MAQTYPLDKVVRIVNSGHPITSPYEQVVVIDPETGKAIEVFHANGRTQLQHLRFFSLFKERKYLLVANNGDSRNEAEGRAATFALRDFTRKWTLGLDVSYLANCKPGNEVKVAESLSTGPHPGAVLNESIARWIRDFAGSQPADLIQNYYSRRADLEAYISTTALKEIGLNLQAVIRLDGEHEVLRPIEIGSVHVPVRVKDFDEEQDLKMKVELQVDPQRKIYAILYRGQRPRFADLIKSETRKYFAGAVSLHEFHAELASANLKSNLTSHLNSVMRPFGWQIGFISFEQQIGIQDPTFFEAKENVEFDEVQEYEEKVVIKNIVQMTLVDYGMYKKAGSQDLNLWIKRNLTEVIRQVLFGKRYIDLLIKFEPLEREIKEKLSARADAIGHTIKQLITVPDLEPYDWLENFALEVEREFDTNTAKFPVKLGIIVTARVRRLQDIESYLNRRQNVPALMKETIVSETRQFLHTINPERFYMRFSYSEPEEEEAVDKVLGGLIKTRLEEKFKADVIGIVFRMLDTEITDRWSRLEKSEGRLEIKLPSLNDVEGVTYRGWIRAEAIHSKGWNRFRTANLDMDQICRRVEEYVLAHLGTFPNTDTVYTDFEGYQQAERVIVGLAKKFAVEEFGLVIRVNSIRRDDTRIENEWKIQIGKRLNALTEIEDQLTFEIVNGGSEEKIADLKRRKEIIELELPGSVMATRIKFNRRELAEPSPVPNRLADVFGGRKGIAARSRARQSNGDEGSE